MKHELENTIALLERTPTALDELLRGLPEVWTEANEGGNTWNVSTVIAHLIHCENEDFMLRARQILASGEAEPFAPFDREGHVRYKGGKTLPQLSQNAASEHFRPNALRHRRVLEQPQLGGQLLQPGPRGRRGRH